MQTQDFPSSSRSESSSDDSLSLVDEPALSSLLEETLRNTDDGEIFIEHAVSESFSFDDGYLKSASYDSGQGFGLRCVAGETVGYAHSTDMTVEALKRAALSVSQVRRGYAGVYAEPPQRTNTHLYPDLNPVLAPGFTEKTDLLAHIDAYARARDPLVVQVSAGLSGSSRKIDIVRADGWKLHDSRPLVRLNVQVIVEKKGRRESGYAGAGGRAAYEEWIQPEHWKNLVDEAIRQARVNLEAVPAPAGEREVVLGPGWPGILLHEAIGHGLEGDFNRKGSSAFSNRLGERVAAPGVTIMDDGTLPGRRGSLSFDDEGETTQKTVLIEDGILKTYLQDRLNARLMGRSPTGNGRRESYACAPLPRMTNTFMLAGEHHPEEILSTLKDGVYAVNFGGGQVDITSGKFVFQCTEAYRVQNGKIREPLKGLTLIGDGPTVLTKISMIGHDMAFDPGIGTCGKAGQGVPVGVGQPTLKIKGLTLGGSAL